MLCWALHASLKPPDGSRPFIPLLSHFTGEGSEARAGERGVQANKALPARVRLQTLGVRLPGPCSYPLHHAKVGGLSPRSREPQCEANKPSVRAGSEPHPKQRDLIFPSLSLNSRILKILKMDFCRTVTRNKITYVIDMPHISHKESTHVSCGSHYCDDSKTFLAFSMQALFTEAGETGRDVRSRQGWAVLRGQRMVISGYFLFVKSIFKAGTRLYLFHFWPFQANTRFSSMCSRVKNFMHNSMWIHRGREFLYFIYSWPVSLTSCPPQVNGEKHSILLSSIKLSWIQ